MRAALVVFLMATRVLGEEDPCASAAQQALIESIEPPATVYSVKHPRAPKEPTIFLKELQRQCAQASETRAAPVIVVRETAPIDASPQTDWRPLGPGEIEVSSSSVVRMGSIWTFWVRLARPMTTLQDAAFNDVRVHLLVDCEQRAAFSQFTLATTPNGAVVVRRAESKAVNPETVGRLAVHSACDGLLDESLASSGRR